MKQVITKRLSIVIAITMMLVLLLNLFLQVESAHEHMAHNAGVTIDSIEEILYTNSEDFEHLSEVLKEEYIIRARTVAYALEQQPQLEYNADELNKLAEFLEVDEIHLFDKNGTLYSGSHPEYNGLTMFSGAQISFFAPMLLDQSLALCQDIMPNTASDKPMIYAAVWREDGEGIRADDHNCAGDKEGQNAGHNVAAGLAEDCFGLKEDTGADHDTDDHADRSKETVLFREFVFHFSLL